MASARQVAANRANAQQSTGPRTAEGKAIVARNGLRHGLLAKGPVLPGVECEEEWEEHRQGILASVAPVGGLETQLAERVADMLWRLARIGRYESAVVGVQLDEAEDKLVPEEGEEGEDNRSAAQVGRDAIKGAENEILALWNAVSLEDKAVVGDDQVHNVFAMLVRELQPAQCSTYRDDPGFWKGIGMAGVTEFHEVDWTGALVKQALVRFAAGEGLGLEEMVVKVRRRLEKFCERWRRRLVYDEVDEAEEQAGRQVLVERALVRAVLPAGPMMERLTRYEAHLNRQVKQNLAELARLRKERTQIGTNRDSVAHIGFGPQNGEEREWERRNGSREEEGEKGRGGEGERGKGAGSAGSNGHKEVRGTNRGGAEVEPICAGAGSDGVGSERRVVSDSGTGVERNGGRELDGPRASQADGGHGAARVVEQHSAPAENEKGELHAFGAANGGSRATETEESAPVVDGTARLEFAKRKLERALEIVAREMERSHGECPVTDNR